jgi:DNA-binding cell septation regulator SpoVG
MQEKVTEIQIIPIKPKDGLVAFANIVYDNAFYFSSIGIYTRPYGGYRLTYPTRKSSTTNLTLFHPINKKVADLIEAAVTRRYEEVMTDVLLSCAE